MTACAGTALDDLVARTRGTWYAADPMAATGEAIMPCTLARLRDLVDGLGIEAAPWQLRHVADLLDARNAAGGAS